MNLKDDLGHLTPRLRRFARALVNGAPARSELADDLVHSALLRMLANISTSHSAELAPRLYAYVTQIHRERLQTHLFATQAQGRYAGAPLGATPVGTTPVGTLVGRDKAIPREPLMARESVSPATLSPAGLSGGIAALGLDDREVLLLVALENLSYADVSRVLRISRAMLIGRLARARARLCEALELTQGRAKVTHLRLVKSDDDIGSRTCASLNDERVDDEDLHSYVDGEMPAQRQSVVVAHLAHAPLDAQRVEAWCRQNEIIRAAFAKVAVEQVPVSLSLAQIGATRGRASDCAVPHGIDAATSTSLPSSLPATLPKRPRLSTARLPGMVLGGLCLGATLLFTSWPWPITPDSNELGPLSRKLGPKDAAPSGLTRHAVAALQARAARPPELGANASLSLVPSAQDRMQMAPDLSGEGWRVIGAGVIHTISCFTYAGGGEVLAFCVQPRGAANLPGLPSREAETSENVVLWRDSSAVYALAATISGSALRRLVARIRLQTQEP